MSACNCIRCGKEYPDAGELTVRGFCPGSGDTKVACRDREIANLQALLRSVTRRLENAREEAANGDVGRAVNEIDAVLEALS